MLDALLRNDVPISFGCKNGSCQSCLVRSTTAPPPVKAQSGLGQVLVSKDCFLACKCPANAIETVDSVGDDIIPKLPTTVVSRTMLSSDVLCVRLRVDAPFEFVPGMFVRFIAPDGLTRSYSIANGPDDGYLEFHIRLIPDGKMSTYLAQTDSPTLLLQGPFGNCHYPSTAQDQTLVFIGSGTGLAPLFAIMNDALLKGHVGPIHLYFGGATIQSLYFLEELHSLGSSHSSVSVTLCTDQEDPAGLAQTGSPVAIALRDHPSFKGYLVFTCGHPELVKAAKMKAFMAGANMADIYADSFDNQSN